MFDISPIQIVMVLALALLIFGPRRLPEIGRAIGRGIHDLRSGITGDRDDAHTPPPAAVTSAAPGEEHDASVLPRAARVE